MHVPEAPSRGKEAVGFLRLFIAYSLMGAGLFLAAPSERRNEIQDAFWRTHYMERFFPDGETVQRDAVLKYGRALQLRAADRGREMLPFATILVFAGGLLNGARGTGLSVGRRAWAFRAIIAQAIITNALFYTIFIMRPTTRSQEDAVAYLGAVALISTIVLLIFSCRQMFYDRTAGVFGLLLSLMLLSTGLLIPAT